MVGTAGLVPTAWSPAHEQWAGVQVQNRFRDAYDRRMQVEDMLAWMAVRAVGEAATRAATSDPGAIREYVLGPDFELAAFKGEALTLRDWNRQLRQPILLAERQIRRVGLAPGGFLAPDLVPRHPRLRPGREPLRAMTAIEARDGRKLRRSHD